jgi:hypothetical protein
MQVCQKQGFTGGLRLQFERQADKAKELKGKKGFALVFVLGCFGQGLMEGGGGIG